MKIRIFTEPHYEVDILQKLYNQHENLQYCDVIFEVQSSTFEAHRCVLAACSSYLASLFRSKYFFYYY